MVRDAISWNASGRPSGADGQHLAVQHDPLGRQGGDHGDDLRHPVGDVVQAPGVHATASPSRCTWTRMPSSLASTAAGRPGFVQRRAGSGALAASIGRTGMPTCRPTAGSASSPGGQHRPRRRRWSRATSPPAAPPRRVRRTHRPAPSCTSESRAPCRISSKTRPRSSRCSASVARANSAPPPAARTEAEPARPARRSRSNAASTSCTVSVGSAAGGNGIQRGPTDPGAALPQAAGQVVTTSSISAGSAAAIVAAIGAAWPAGSGCRRCPWTSPRVGRVASDHGDG